MKSFVQSIRKWLRDSFPSQQALDERYLAQAADIHELEYRMRRLDAERRYPAPYATRPLPR